MALTLALALASAAEARVFQIPPGTLGQVITALGLEAGLTIAISDADLAARRSKGVRGDYSARGALAQALRDTGAEAVFYDEATIRIVRRRLPSAPPDPPAPPRPVVTDIQELVVTASKQDILLGRYPGSAKIVEFDPERLARDAPRGSSAFLETLPTLSGTNLGRGRNKIHVRGIADSSFNGPTQATVGQYLGDVRLNYNAPDPDLSLYDLSRLEVLSGPQGTLYGAGSLGGIVRLVPNPPDPDGQEASASAGLSSTRSGGLGYDAGAMVNLPLGKRLGAIRYVAYGAREAGYVDDPRRGLKDINRTRILGQRLGWRVEDVKGWTLDLTGVAQTIESRDGQYIVKGGGSLERRTRLAQPFNNDFRLASLTGRRGAAGGELVTTTSIAGYELASVFDASEDDAAPPRRFEEHNDILLISHETRLAGGGREAPWVVGATAFYNINRLARRLGEDEAPEKIAGFRNSQLEVSVFGQASRALSPSLTLTAGARLTGAGGESRLRLDGPVRTPEQASRKQLRLIPMVALDWRWTANLSTYAHYQHGFRAGGFAIAPQGSASALEEFRADDLGELELGLRWREPLALPLSGRVALFAIDWNHIQADLVDRAGLPFTSNVGSGRIYGVDLEARWRVSSSLQLTGSAFFNDTFFDSRPEGAPSSGKRTLPNVPRDGVRLEATWRRELAPDVALSTSTSFAYVGKSFLAAGTAFDAAQGTYFTGSLGARLDLRGVGVSVDISNIGDTRGNTFAFGNPFSLGRGGQETPLRPRTIRIGLDARF